MRKKLSVLCTTFLLPLLMTVPTFAADSSFSDVAPDAPYAESIAYLVEHGITNGIGADTFSPDAPVTIRQWSVMLCRAYGLPIEGDTWEEMSYVAMVEAYSHGWMYSSIFSAPETQMCRGALYDSAFAAAGMESSWFSCCNLTFRLMLIAIRRKIALKKSIKNKSVILITKYPCKTRLV